MKKLNLVGLLFTGVFLMSSGAFAADATIGAGISKAVAKAYAAHATNEVCIDNDNGGVTANYYIKEGTHGEVIWYMDTQPKSASKKCANLTHLGVEPGKTVSVWYKPWGKSGRACGNKNAIIVANNFVTRDFRVRGKTIFDVKCSRK